MKNKVSFIYKNKWIDASSLESFVKALVEISPSGENNIRAFFDEP